MTDNVEISNPMYLRGEDLEETEETSDPSGNSRVSSIILLLLFAKAKFTNFLVIFFKF